MNHLSILPVVHRRLLGAWRHADIALFGRGRPFLTEYQSRNIGQGICTLTSYVVANQIER